MEGVLFIVLNYCGDRDNEVSCIIQTLEDNVRDTRMDYGNTCRLLNSNGMRLKTFRSVCALWYLQRC
jgi:hypothetical protein